MKRLITLIIFIFLFSELVFGNHNKYRPRQEKKKVNYKKKTTLIYGIEYKSGKPVKKLLWETKYKYDDKGNKIEWAEYNSDGSLSRKDKCKYDSKGYKIEEAVYKPDGSLAWKRKYKYDNRRNKIEERKYNSKNKLTRLFEYKYEY